MCWFVVCLCLVAIQQIKLINILPELMFASLCSFVKSWYFFLGENLTVFLCFQDAGKAKETLVVGWIPSCLDPWHQPSCATWLKSALRHFKFLRASGRRRPRGVLGSRKHVGPNHVRPAEEKMFDQPSRKEKTKGEKSEPLVLNDPQSDARITGVEGKIWPADYLAGKAVPLSLFWFQVGGSGSHRRRSGKTWSTRGCRDDSTWVDVMWTARQNTHTRTWKPPHNPKSQGGVAYTSSLRNSCTAIFRLQVCVYAATGD